LFWRGPGALAHNLAAFDKHHGGDALNAELRGQHLVGVHVHLGDANLAREFFGELVQNRRNHAARPTPLCPEVNQHRHFAIDDQFFEGRIRDVDGFVRWQVVVIGGGVFFFDEAARCGEALHLRDHLCRIRNPGAAAAHQHLATVPRQQNWMFAHIELFSKSRVVIHIDAHHLHAVFLGLAQGLADV
jgi:hypothetical protein